MSKRFVVGKQYKLVAASKQWELQEVIDRGHLKFPDDGLFIVSAVDDDGSVHSLTKGILWRDVEHMPFDDIGWTVANHEALELGAFELVE